MIAHELDDGDSLQVIENVRNSLAYATLPVAFVMSSENPDYAFNALRCGATEVFSTTEYGALGNFIADCAERPSQGDFSGRVLLLEDSASQAAFVARLMEELGLSVDVARDVDEAIRLYQPRKYLIVIADVVLKNGKSGVGFVRRLRQDHAWRQPVLVMSGFDDLPRRLLAIKSGADDFLSKPFSPEELVWRMKRCSTNTWPMSRIPSRPPICVPLNLTLLCACSRRGRGRFLTKCWRVAAIARLHLS